MGARYLTRPARSWIEDETFAEPARHDIFVTEAAPVATGIIDASGSEFFRMPNPIGFGRDEEWA